MKIFVTVSFRNGANREEIDHLCSLVGNAGFADFCFSRDLEAAYSNPREMMTRAKEEIEKCDGLLFNASAPSTSRAMEAGIAYQTGKKIIVIVKEGAELKATVRGIADSIITYSQIDDIADPLKDLYLSWTSP